jgi:uncharacterized protein
MSWSYVSLGQAQPQAWKNGGGITQELLAWPNAHDWSIRLSVAQVNSNGPFSVFEGVQRWFCVLAGAGVELEVNGTKHPLTHLSEPFTFPGAASTQCTLLDGETQDFNLMLKRATGTLTRVRGEMRGVTPTNRFIAAYSVAAASDIHYAGSNLKLPEKTLCWLHSTSTETIHICATDCLYMEITP